MEDKNTMKTIAEIRQEIENKKTRSAWDRGVKEYALELLEDMENERNAAKETDMTVYPATLQAELLNGAMNWKQYSWGGCSLVYDMQIAKRLCSPSELKKTRNGERQPNASEQWLDVQTRALHQAENMIYACIHSIVINPA
jgi:hypothetical protein